MWLPRRGSPMILLILLSGSGVAFARPGHKIEQARADKDTPSTSSESLFEVEPRSGPPVMRDPEILNHDEILSLSRKYGSDLADALLDGERHREKAVRERDSIKLSCIQDRLSNMKLMKKLADDGLVALDRPAIRADDLRLRHEFRGVEMAHERVNQLHQELLECVGENLEVTMGNGQETTIPSTRATDPAAVVTETPRIERPIPASPFN